MLAVPTSIYWWLHGLLHPRLPKVIMICYERSSLVKTNFEPNSWYFISQSTKNSCDHVAVIYIYIALLWIIMVITVFGTLCCRISEFVIFILLQLKLPPIYVTKKTVCIWRKSRSTFSNICNSILIFRKEFMASHKLNTFQNIDHIVPYVNSCVHLMYIMYVKMQNKNSTCKLTCMKNVAGYI